MESPVATNNRAWMHPAFAMDESGITRSCCLYASPQRRVSAGGGGGGAPFYDDGAKALALDSLQHHQTPQQYDSVVERSTWSPLPSFNRGGPTLNAASPFAPQTAYSYTPPPPQPAFPTYSAERQPQIYTPWLTAGATQTPSKFRIHSSFNFDFFVRFSAAIAFSASGDDYDDIDANSASNVAVV